jgi:hypothetical protein
MFKAIMTRYIGPTNHNQAKIKAWAADVKPVYTKMNDELTADENMTAAAISLAQKYGWAEAHQLVGGGLPDNTGNVYCVQPKGK